MWASVSWAIFHSSRHSPVAYTRCAGCRSAVTLALLIACPTKVYHYHCRPLFPATAHRILSRSIPPQLLITLPTPPLLVAVVVASQLTHRWLCGALKLSDGFHSADVVDARFPLPAYFNFRLLLLLSPPSSRPRSVPVSPLSVSFQRPSNELIIRFAVSSVFPRYLPTQRSLIFVAPTSTRFPSNYTELTIYLPDV